MTFRFTIQGRLSGANEIKSANRSHWSRGARLAKENIQACWWAIQAEKCYHNSPFTKRVSVYFRWIEPNNKRDPDNIMSGQKAILDSLVRCGVIPNDTRQWIGLLWHEFPEPDKKNPRIEVEVHQDPDFGNTTAALQRVKA